MYPISHPPIGGIARFPFGSADSNKLRVASLNVTRQFKDAQLVSKMGIFGHVE